MDEAAPPPGLRRLDRHFRWRGSEVSRLEALTDTAFATVLGLLFLRAAPPESFGDLFAAMKSLVPFAATFAIITYLWVEHWLFSRRYDLQDPLTTVLNLLLLFLLLFYAYPLKFLFTLMFVECFGPIGDLTHAKMMEGYTGTHDVGSLFVVYGVGFSSIFAVIAAMYARALHFADDLHLDPVERLLTKSGIVQASLQAGIGLLSIAFALAGVGVQWGLPGWTFMLAGPLMGMHGGWESRHVQKLQDAAAQERSRASNP